MNRDNSGNSIDLILVGKCLLSDYRKEEIIWSMNFIMVSAQEVTQFAVYSSQ